MPSCQQLGRLGFGEAAGQTECVSPAAGGIHAVHTYAYIFSQAELHPAHPERGAESGCWCCLCLRKCSVCLHVTYVAYHVHKYIHIYGYM